MYESDPEALYTITVLRTHSRACQYTEVRNAASKEKNQLLNNNKNDNLKKNSKWAKKLVVQPYMRVDRVIRRGG